MFSDLTKMVTLQNLLHDGGFQMGVSQDMEMFEITFTRKYLQNHQLLICFIDKVYLC
jgi:hypothetical protein